VKSPGDSGLSSDVSVPEPLVRADEVRKEADNLKSNYQSIQEQTRQSSLSKQQQLSDFNNRLSKGR